MSAAEERTRWPGIFKRGGRYTYRYRDRRGKIRRGSARTIDEAKAKRAAALADVWRGDHFTAGQETFKAYATDWLDSFQGGTASGIQESTRREYRKTITARAIPYFGGMRLAAITPPDVRGYVKQMQDEGCSPNTIRLALAPVKAMFATALEDGAIRSNPATGVRAGKAENVTEEIHAKALTEDELAQLLAHISPEGRALCEFLVQTGLRIGEALELRWGDVNLGQGRLHVRRRVYEGVVGPPKSRYGRRSVPVGESLGRMLWQRRKAARQAGDGDLVFPSATGGHLNPSNLHTRLLKPAARAAGVEWAGFHTLRHTCGSMLFARGLNAKQIQLWLGHHSAAFTLSVYVTLLDDDLPAVDLLGGGNESGKRVGTRPAETSRDAEPADTAEPAVLQALR